MRLFSWIPIGLVQAYRWLLSPILPQTCRYWPSCSSYAGEALARHGVLAGGRLALRRILSCHPWGGWGYDPVPDRGPKSRGPIGSSNPSGAMGPRPRD